MRYSVRLPGDYRAVRRRKLRSGAPDDTVRRSQVHRSNPRRAEILKTLSGGGKRGSVYTAPWGKAAVQGADKIHSSPAGGEFIVDKYYLRGTAESVLVANAEVVLRSMTVLLLKPDGSRPVRELLPGGGYEKAVVEEPRNDCTDSGGGLSKCNYNGSLVRPAVLRQLPAKLLHEGNGALRVAREMLALPGVDQDIVAQWIILTFREEQM